VSLKPIRVESDSLVAEFLANVDVRQATAFNPGPSKAKAAQPRSAKVLEGQVNREVIERSFELPDYNESRARSEYEKANLLELERKQKEKLLLPADQVERVWANTVATVKTKLLAVPTRLRQRIPHLSLEEVAIADELIRESLIELSGEGDGDGQ
jgi:phage terminase Nu1 subunit (DNA packaging protein)